jgi:hypothetical protein
MNEEGIKESIGQEPDQTALSDTIEATKQVEEVKLPAHRAGLPGHAVASRMRANEISFFIVPLDPAYRAGLAVHLPVNISRVSPIYATWCF